MSTSDPFESVARASFPADGGIVYSEGDPGAIGPRRLWCVASTGALSIRDATNTGWVTISEGSPVPGLIAAHTFAGGTDGASVASDAVRVASAFSVADTDTDGFLAGGKLTIPAGLGGLYACTIRDAWAPAGALVNVVLSLTWYSADGLSNLGSVRAYRMTPTAAFGNDGASDTAILALPEGSYTAGGVAPAAGAPTMQVLDATNSGAQSVALAPFVYLGYLGAIP